MPTRPPRTNQPAGGAGQERQAAPGSTGPGFIASAASALGTATRIAADAGATAKGTADVARPKPRAARSRSRADRHTTGGRSPPRSRRKEAAAENIDVPDQQPAPSFGDNSLAGGPADADPESEVAAFANREQGRDGTTA